MSALVVSAPGKIILHGEHAVVYGKKALAASLDMRTFLQLVPCSESDTIATVLPDIGLNPSWSAQHLQKSLSLPLCPVRKPEPPSDDLITKLKQLAGIDPDTTETKYLAIVAFLYLYASVTPQNGKLPGVRIHLSSCLPTAAGLGSSAAFSACLSSALLLWQGHVSKPTPTHHNNGTAKWDSDDLELINQWAFQAEKIIHGNPSGIDNSISTHGGALLFQKGKLQPLESVPEISILLINTGVPRSTKVLVAGVRDKYNKYPEIIGPVLDCIEAITDQCQQTLARLTTQPESSPLYADLQDLMTINQHQLSVLGVSQTDLDTICTLCQQQGLAGKLTGAGGGGCAFCLIPPGSEDAVQKVNLQVSDLGYSCWKTSVGGHGVLQHLQLDNGHFTLPQSFQAALTDGFKSGDDRV